MSPLLNSHRTTAIVRWMAARNGTRGVLNSLYRARSWEQRERLHARFAKIFREYDGAFAAGEWDVDFAGRTVRIPLSSSKAWLTWDLALSVVGHEPEIKQTYQTIIDPKPRLVLDVGANYGTHSLLFLVHGVPTISFEPNPNCHASIRELCAANGVTPTLEPVAVGASEGSVDLWFPERDEWLGTTDAGTRDQLQAQMSLKKLTVRMITIDGYVDAHALTPDVIKIDTEGSDFMVMQGAECTLDRARPVVLFESWPAQRDAVATFLGRHRYDICALPLTSAPPRVLPASEFRSTGVANFVALPRERTY